MHEPHCIFFFSTFISSSSITIFIFLCKLGCDDEYSRMSCFAHFFRQSLFLSLNRRFFFVCSRSLFVSMFSPSKKIGVGASLRSMKLYQSSTPTSIPVLRICDDGHVSSDDQKRVCSRQTRLQHEHIFRNFNCPSRK